LLWWYFSTVAVLPYQFISQSPYNFFTEYSRHHHHRTMWYPSQITPAIASIWIQFRPSWTNTPSIHFLSLSMLHHHHPYFKASLTASPTNPSIWTLSPSLHTTLLAIYTFYKTKAMCMCCYFYDLADHNHLDTMSTDHLQSCRLSSTLIIDSGSFT